MLKYFDVIVTHEDVKSGLNKPAPDIFLLACEKLGILPEHCRGFEDADVGIQALNSAKIDAIDVRKMKNYPHTFN
jgi:HAD superfamily hydrolase (TIGR01509 family)